MLMDQIKDGAINQVIFKTFLAPLKNLGEPVFVKAIGLDIVNPVEKVKSRRA